MKGQFSFGLRRPRRVPGLAIAAALISVNACATPLSLKGAELGMTLTEWRSLAPPEGVGPDAIPACSDDPRIATLAHNPLSAALQARGTVTCAYLDLLGHTALPNSIHLGGAYRASDLQYLFVRGRLGEIRFKASIDAYSVVTAMLEQQFGPPNQSMRDQVRTADGPFARVVQTWRSPSGEIVLADPSDEATQLQVSMSSLDADAARRTIAATDSSPGR
jgi:hypothetical protein